MSRGALGVYGSTLAALAISAVVSESYTVYLTFIILCLPTSIFGLIASSLLAMGTTLLVGADAEGPIFGLIRVAIWSACVLLQVVLVHSVWSRLHTGRRSRRSAL